MRLGLSLFEGRRLLLEWRRLDVGRFREDACVGKLWVRVLGLPVHLWGREFFKWLGDACGGFVAVDEETTERRNLKWARTLIKSSVRKTSSQLFVVDREVVYAAQLWWEILPW